MNNLDEGFFKDKYESYKDKVLSILYKHFGIKLPKDLHDAEDWIRDYFVDKFSAFDCADSMRTHFKQYGVAENMKMDIKTATEILKENHYILESEESMSSKIWGLCEDGFVSWKDVAQAALKYMDEDSIKDMNNIYEWVKDEDETETTDEDTVE